MRGDAGNLRVSAGPRASSARAGRTMLALALVATFTRAGLAVADGPPPAPADAGAPAPRVVLDAGQKLPALPTETTEASGTIATSTRGHKGPVRLRLERSGADAIDVLMPADDECARLGLALSPGSSITVRGSLLAGANPILVAREMVVGGRRVDLRAKRPAGPTRAAAPNRGRGAAGERP